MSYPGNSSLSKEIRNRILTTFEQTLTLAGDGSRQEALLGCDFILRLDPYFSFAQSLQERLEEGEGPIAVDDLRELLAATTEDEGQAPEAPSPPPVAPEPPTESWNTTSDGADLDALFGEPTPAPEPLAPLESPPPAIVPEPPAPEPPPVKPEPPPVKPEPTSVEPEPTPPVAPDAPAAPPEEPPAFDDLGDETLSADQLLDEVSEEMGAASDDEDYVHDAGTQQRIDELLAEGQAAFDESEYQTAIDSWSRIFLIDIDHAEANRRIEQARKLKAEIERQVEEVFHEGLTELEAGRLAEAREAFQRVLDMQANHLAAREYLLKIDSGALAPPSPAPPPQPEGDDLLDLPDEMSDGVPEPGPDLEGEESPTSPRTDESLPGMPDFPDLPDLPDEAEVDGPLAEASGEAPPTEWARAAQAGAPAPQRRAFVFIAAGVLLVVVVLGWLLYSQWPKLFPNSAASETAAARSDIDPIRRALALHEESQTPIAIAQLRRLPPDHPKHAEAQALIAQWETASQAQSEEVKGPSEAEVERRLALLAMARRAVGSRYHLEAQERLLEAQAISPLEGEDLALHEDVQQRLAVVNKELGLFRQGDWEFALRTLWFLREELPENQDVRRLIVDSYHNLGVRDLQRGNPREASQKFREALALSSGDRELLRLSAFAETYRERPADLLYQIFVKYLPFR